MSTSMSMLALLTSFINAVMKASIFISPIADHLNLL